MASLVLMISVAVVPESAAADGVDDDDEDDDGDVDESQHPPLSPYVVQHCLLTRVAIHAQLFLPIAPCFAIRVGYFWTRFRRCPVGRVVELEPAVGWWLATTRLYMC